MHALVTRLSQETAQEMKIMLDVYKSASKDDREKLEVEKLFMIPIHTYIK